MQLLVEGKAEKLPQPAEGATYEPIMKKDLAQVLVLGLHTQCTNMEFYYLDIGNGNARMCVESWENVREFHGEISANSHGVNVVEFHTEISGNLQGSVWDFHRETLWNFTEMSQGNIGEFYE